MLKKLLLCALSIFMVCGTAWGMDEEEKQKAFVTQLTKFCIHGATGEKIDPKNPNGASLYDIKLNFISSPPAKDPTITSIGTDAAITGAQQFIIKKIMETLHLLWQGNYFECLPHIPFITPLLQNKSHENISTALSLVSCIEKATTKKEGDALSDLFGNTFEKINKLETPQEIEACQTLTNVIEQCRLCNPVTTSFTRMKYTALITQQKCVSYEDYKQQTLKQLAQQEAEAQKQQQKEQAENLKNASKQAEPV